MTPPLIYLDQAATSWPKAPGVAEALTGYLRDVGANPGRSGHRLANEAERIRLDTRAALAELFGVRDPFRVIFAHNATAALNIAIHGLLPPGAHAVTTGLEHNAVMRPLRAAEQRGVSISTIACAADGMLDPADLAAQLRPETRLIIATHASNVCGTVLPIRELGAQARAHGIPFLVDSAQTAGVWPIDLTADNIDLLAFSGHKGLLGPTGTGGLVLHDDFDPRRLPALVQGGTGSRSEHETQPEFLPDKFEAGTPNILGLAGLRAAVRYIQQRGSADIQAVERDLTRRLIEGLSEMRGVGIQGPRNPRRQTAVVSLTVAGHTVSELAYRLDEEFGVLCRPGLHCAPAAHRTLGTFPDGTLRLAPGPFTTTAEIDAALAAIATLAR